MHISKYSCRIDYGGAVEKLCVKLQPHFDFHWYLVQTFPSCLCEALLILPESISIYLMWTFQIWYIIISEKKKNVLT